jgi:hypothetical protein
MSEMLDEAVTDDAYVALPIKNTEQQQQQQPQWF